MCDIINLVNFFGVHSVKSETKNFFHYLSEKQYFFKINILKSSLVATVFAELNPCDFFSLWLPEERLIELIQKLLMS